MEGFQDTILWHIELSTYAIILNDEGHGSGIGMVDKCFQIGKDKGSWKESKALERENQQGIYGVNLG